jgi:hypothetical protein
MGKIVSQKGLSFPTYTKTFAEGLFPAMITEIKCNGKQDCKDHQTDTFQAPQVNKA